MEPFVHEGRTLYAHEVEFKGGRKQTIYFFSAGSPKAGAPCAMPSGYEVATTKNGMPVLRRKAA